MQPKGVLTTNVDVLTNPELTWEVQRFFEEEHGVQPVPVVHSRTSLKYLERDLAAGRYDLIGLGGPGIPARGEGILRCLKNYERWADEAYMLICPASNGRMPLVKTHGFAITSWRFLCRWPWWSVDSTSWTKLAAYGWLYVPPWDKKQERWRFDKPPVKIGVSRKEYNDEKQNQYWWNVKKKTVREIGREHYDTGNRHLRYLCDLWLKHLGLVMGSYNDKGEVFEEGVSTTFRVRAQANCHYFKSLEESRPEWPHALDDRIVKQYEGRYQKGFGFV
jgi:hypothetical protein